MIASSSKKDNFTICCHISHDYHFRSDNKLMYLIRKVHVIFSLLVTISRGQNSHTFDDVNVVVKDHQGPILAGGEVGAHLLLILTER